MEELEKSRMVFMEGMKDPNTPPEELAKLMEDYERSIIECRADIMMFFAEAYLADIGGSMVDVVLCEEDYNKDGTVGRKFYFKRETDDERIVQLKETLDAMDEARQQMALEGEALRVEVEELKDYKFKYEELCK